MDRRRVNILLGLILAIAATARFWGLTFGLPFVHARPDELIVVSTVLRFFTESLNPRFFDYPSMYLYFLGGLLTLYYWGGRMVGWFTSPSHFVGGTHGRWEAFYLIGRAATAVFGTLTVLWVYRIANVLFNEATGLLAALFLALSFLHVRDSHYATTDVTLTFLVMWTVLSLVRLHIDRRRSHAYLAGVLGGLAMGTKYNAVLLVVPMAVVELLHAWSRRREWQSVVRGSYLPVMVLLMVITFFATSPYLLLDYSQVLRDFRTLGRSLAVGMTPRDLLGPGWVYHFKFSLLYGLGLPLLAAALGGIVLMARRRPSEALVLGSFPVAYYAVAGASADVFVRYMIPVVPFLCVFAAFLVTEMAAALAARTGHGRQPVIAAVVGIAVIAPSAVPVVQFDTILAREDSRLAAAEWVHQNVPRGASIYMSGNPYGHPPLEDRVDPKYQLLFWDYRRNYFTEKGREFPNRPDWMIVQRSALPYSHTPETLDALLRKEYRLAHVIQAANLRDTRNVYDIQDAFYVPYGGFNGVQRPGPNLEIYERRSAPP